MRKKYNVRGGINVIDGDARVPEKLIFNNGDGKIIGKSTRIEGAHTEFLTPVVENFSTVTNPTDNSACIELRWNNIVNAEGEYIYFKPEFGSVFLGFTAFFQDSGTVKHSRLTIEFWEENELLLKEVGLWTNVTYKHSLEKTYYLDTTNITKIILKCDFCLNLTDRSNAVTAIREYNGFKEYSGDLIVDESINVNGFDVEKTMRNIGEHPLKTAVNVAPQAVVIDETGADHCTSTVEYSNPPTTLELATGQAEVVGTKLTNGNYISVYKDTGNNDIGTIVMYDSDGNILQTDTLENFGDPAKDAIATQLSIIENAENEFLILAGKTANGGFPADGLGLYCKWFTADTASFTAGTGNEIELQNAPCIYISHMLRLSDTRVAVLANDFSGGFGSQKIRTLVLEKSTDWGIAGEAVALSNGSETRSCLTKIDENRFLVFYYQSGCYAQIYNFDGSTLNKTDDKKITVNPNEGLLQYAGDDKIIYVSGNSGNLRVRYNTIAGNTFGSWGGDGYDYDREFEGSPVAVESGRMQIFKKGIQYFLFAANNSTELKLIIFNADGTDVNITQVHNFDTIPNSTHYYKPNLKLDGNTLYGVYRSSDTTLKSLTLTGVGSGGASPHGWAIETGEVGDNVKIEFGNIIYGFSGLTPGKLYSIGENGQLSDTPGNCLAINETTIKYV